MIDDKELALKMKPSIKRFKFQHEELLAIAVAVKQNPEKMQDCIDFLNDADTSKSSEDIKNQIIEICYR